MCEAIYQGSPKHFSAQYPWMFLTFTGASEGWSVSLPSDLLASVSLCLAQHSVRHVRIRMGVLWYLLQSSNSLILIPTNFWAQKLLGIFTHAESRRCDTGLMALGGGLSLAELPQACLPLVWGRRIKMWYTLLEILPNLNLPRCHHLNADCRTSSEVHWI